MATLKIGELRGVTEDLAKHFVETGIKTANALLAKAAQPKERAELAANLGIDSKELLQIANRADLARINGIGPVYSDLLEKAGVDTVMELRTRNGDNLHAKLVEIAADEQVKRVPRLEEVRDWIEQAKQQERAIHY